MPLQLLYSPQTFSFFSLLSLGYAALFFLSFFFSLSFFLFSLGSVSLGFWVFFFFLDLHHRTHKMVLLLEIIAGPIFFFFFSPFSSQIHKKKNNNKNKRLGQRIGCCGFVNFLGASRMLMNFVGLSFKLRTEVVVVGIGG